jgi:hypothetical protein
VCKLNHYAWIKNAIKLEETIQRVATTTIGYTRKQANKEWFDEECAKVNEEKNAARNPNQNQSSQECVQTSRDKKRDVCSEKMQRSSTKRL